MRCIQSSINLIHNTNTTNSDKYDSKRHIQNIHKYISSQHVTTAVLVSEDYGNPFQRIGLEQRGQHHHAIKM